MNHLEVIERALKDNVESSVIARKIFLAYPTAIFIDDEDLEFEILNKIKEYFDIDFSSIRIVGSSKTKKSLHKDNIFTPKVSDLDVAIINPGLFLKYVEISYGATDGYSNLTGFRRLSGGRPAYTDFFKYITKGIFRPDLMPRCEKSTDWRTFFNRLSAEYSGYFKSINAGIYASEYIFEQKQARLIDNYKISRGI